MKRSRSLEAQFPNIGPWGALPKWLTLSPVSDSAFRLFAVLLSYADANYEAWPSRATLASHLHCSTKTVDRAVKELIEANAIFIEKRPTPDGFHSSNHYFLKLNNPSLGPFRQP